MTKLHPANKQYAAYTYCDFGDPARKEIIYNHTSVATAQRAFSRLARIYNKLHGWRCWQETTQGDIINERPQAPRP